MFSGKIATSKRAGASGIEVSISGTSYLAHRIIWAIVHGDFDPFQSIDHINGRRDDNRISNLRLISHAENMRNLPLPRNSRSGIVGVTFNKKENRWHAKLRFGGKVKFVGSFKTVESAAAAIAIAREECGYHPNHGRARPA